MDKTENPKSPKQLKESVTFESDTGFFDRQFNETFPAYINKPKEEFLKDVVEHYKKEGVIHRGYADFCGVIIMPNHVDMKYGLVEINDNTRDALITRYEARGNALPVLRRFFSLKKLQKLGYDRPVANYLYIEMYTAQQMNKEQREMKQKNREKKQKNDEMKKKNEEMNNEEERLMLEEESTKLEEESKMLDFVHTATWTVFNVKPVMKPDEKVPNEPTTIVRNALGAKYGGSGKEIDEDEHKEAVLFFEKYAFVDHLN